MKHVFVSDGSQRVISCSILVGALLLVCSTANTTPPNESESKPLIPIGVVDFGVIIEEFDRMVVEIHGKNGMERIVASIGDTEYAKLAARKEIDVMAYQYFVVAVAKSAKEQKIDLVINSFDPACSSANPEILFKPKITPGYLVFYSDRVDITEGVRRTYRESVTKYLKGITVE